MWKKILAFVWKSLKNYYVLATLGMLIWITFFDSDNLISQYEQRQEMNNLLEQKIYYTGEIEKNKQLYHSLKTDPKALERFGREKYLMKKDYEVIYLVIIDSSAKEEKDKK